MIMNKKLLYSLLGLFIGLVISFSANADLDKAIAFAEAGDVKKGQMELVNIAQRAMDGNPKSMCEFGTMYMKEGYWIVQSDEDALEWWLKSAELGYAPCQFSVGSAYLIGKGVEKDLSQAKFWLQKAIDSTYTKYSKVSKQLYAIHELDKY
jgi:TPR repeat protein